MRTTSTALAALALAVGSFLPTASADGLIITRPTPQNTPRRGVMPRQVPLQVNHHDVKVDISGSLAQTAIDQEFQNPSDMQLEGTYLFPVPRGAVISQFSMAVSGSQMPGEVQEIEKATEVYEDIVRRVEDPALLEYVGSRLVSMRIFPIEARQKKPVKITYNEELTAHRGLVRYVYPLNTEKFSKGAIARVSVEVRIKEHLPLGAIYSPTHDITIHRPDAKTAVVRFEARDVKPARDFVLYYQKAESDLGLSTLSYQPPTGHGYFAAIVSPHQLGDVKPQAKDVVFVVDTSHSMREQSKMDHVRKALAHCVSRLGNGDRFNVIDFSTAARQLDDGLIAVSDASKQAAARYVAEMTPAGGTNVQDALEVLGEVCEDARADRPLMVILVTDGEPTIGAKDRDTLCAALDGVRKKTSLRLFALGVGDELDTTLLDGLARTHNGLASYIEAGDDLQEEVRAFFDKVAQPALSNVSLKVTGKTGQVAIFDMQPAQIGDLFYGSQLVVLGRYRGHGRAVMTLEGEHRGRTQRWDFEVDFAGTTGANSYLAHLFAKRKVARLLEAIRLQGETPERKQQIVDLARRHGILTPYTGYLVLENEQMWRERFGDERGPKVHNERAKPSRPNEAAQHVFGTHFNFSMRAAAAERLKSTRGEQAVQASRDIAQIRDEGLGIDDRTDQEMVRRVGDKAFYRHGERWVDSAFEDGAATRKVTYLSKAYFALLRAEEGIGRYLALGKSLVVVTADGTAIEIVAP